jgi:sensor c-di-GMP phosphodiesterase-like protein
VETILSIARHLHLKVVAEGVETQAQADFLNARAEVLHQGYLYGPAGTGAGVFEPSAGRRTLTNLDVP